MRIRLKQLLIVPIDIFLITICFFLALHIRYFGDSDANFKYLYDVILSPPFLGIVGIYVITFSFFRMYSMMLSHISIGDMFRGITGNICASVLVFLYNLLVFPVILNSERFNNSIIVISGLLVLIATFGIRIVPRTIDEVLRLFLTRTGDIPISNVLVYGAGNAGLALYKDTLNNKKSDYKVICFYDDDISKSVTRLAGLKVYGSDTDLSTLTEALEIDTIIIAIPSATREQMTSIIKKCSKTSCSIKKLPALYDLIIDGYFEPKHICDVDVADILGRDETKIDIDEVSRYVYKKTILITGAGGSIGSELCRQIIKYKPKKLILIDIYENNVYELENELRSLYGSSVQMKVYISSVRDYNMMDSIFKNEKPNVVYHAAAHKHVPFMERNPGEAIKNNVFGTLNLVELSNVYNVDTFVLLSSKQAENPTNVLSATKRMAEMILQSYAQDEHPCKTKYLAVRFCNVMGSSGSVVPLFQKQISQMGPVTVTHHEARRSFISIPEAAKFAIQAGALEKSGEILDIERGKSICIDELARDMIRISGYIPNVDIQIVYTGLRPGEMINEEELPCEEGKFQSSIEGVSIRYPIELQWEDISASLKTLRNAVDSSNPQEIIECLRECIKSNAGFEHQRAK